MTIDAKLANGPLTEKAVIQLGIQLAQGLAAAHHQHIIHRGLEARDVRLTADGQLKILDFGPDPPSRRHSSRTSVWIWGRHATFAGCLRRRNTARRGACRQESGQKAYPAVAGNREGEGGIERKPGDHQKEQHGSRAVADSFGHRGGAQPTSCIADTRERRREARNLELAVGGARGSRL